MDCTGKRFTVESYTYKGPADARVETYTDATGAVTRYDYTGTSATPTRVRTGCQIYTSGSCSSGDPTVPSTDTEYEISSLNQVLSVTSGGAKTCYQYNAAGQLAFETPRWPGSTACPSTAQDASTVYTYTALGQVATVDRPDPQGTWTYLYYGSGQLKEVRDPLYDPGSPTLHRVAYSYHPTGETASVADELNKATTTAITRNVTDQTTCNGGVSGSAGNDIDNNPVRTPCKIVATTMPAVTTTASVSTEIFDKTGNARLMISPTGARSWNIYGKLSRLTKTVGPTDTATPNPVITIYEHDDDGRVVATRAGTESGDDVKTTTTYDKRGRVTSQVSAKYDTTTVTTAYAFDAAGRQVQHVMAAPDASLPPRGPDGLFPAPTGASDRWTLRATTYAPTGAVKQTSLYRSDSGWNPGTQATTTTAYDTAGRAVCRDTRVAAAQTGVTETHHFVATDYDASTGHATQTRNQIGAGRTVTDGVTTTGSSTVTSATANFTAGDLGASITGTGIPAGATITAVNSSTSVTISANATSSGTGRTLTIDGCGDPTNTSRWAITARGYHNDGSLLWQQDPIQHAANPANVNYRTTYGYDTLGRVTTVDTPDPNNPGAAVVTTRTCYTARGEIASTIDPSGSVTAYGYTDRHGVIQTVVDPTGMDYNPAAPCNSTARTGTDTHRGETTYSYDTAANRVARTVYNDTLTTQVTERWTYDIAGRVTGYWDPIRTYTPTNLDTATEAYTYTVTDGRLVSKAVRTGDLSDSGDPTGSSKRVVTEHYLRSGAIDHVTEDKYDTANTVAWAVKTTTAYDPLGRVSTLSRQEGTPTLGTAQVASFEYNTAGSITKATYPYNPGTGNVTAEYTWDLAGNNTKTKTPSNAWFRQRYDAGQRLEYVDVASFGVWVNLAQYTRNANSAITRTDLSGGSAGNRVNSYHNASGTKATYSQLVGSTTTANTLTYDDDNRLTEVCDATGTTGGTPNLPACQTTDDRTIYSYDNPDTTTYVEDAGQLATATRKDAAGATTASWKYTYGNTGNRRTQTVFDGTNTTTTHYRTNDANRLCTETIGSDTPTCANPTGATITYGHDSAGRRTTRIQGSTTRTNTYDPGGRLQKVAHSGGATDSQTLSFDPT